MEWFKPTKLVSLKSSRWLAAAKNIQRQPLFTRVTQKAQSFTRYPVDIPGQGWYPRISCIQEMTYDIYSISCATWTCCCWFSCFFSSRCLWRRL